MSEEIRHQDLASIIKGTHAELRLKILKLPEQDGCSENEKLEDDVWLKHADDVMSADQTSYSKAMNDLVTTFYQFVSLSPTLH